MFLIQNIPNTLLIGIHVPDLIIGAYNVNVVTIFRFTNVIGALALSAPNIITINPSCNDPLVQILSQGITTLIGILTALGVAIAVMGIIIGGLMRATAWGSDQRIGMSNKAISSAIVGLVIVLLGVAVGSAVPGWFHLQNSTCPIVPSSVSTPAPAPAPPSTPTR